MQVLIASDQSGHSFTIKSLLEQILPGQVEVKLAITPAQLEEKLRLITPDIIFLSEQLGGVSAFDLLERHHAGFVPIVLCAQSEALALRSFQYGALHYLLSPITRFDVEFALRKLARLKTFK